MWSRCLAFAAFTVPSCGCSILIAESGKDLSPLQTREQVRAEFGTPDTFGENADGPYECFQTRRKVAENFRGMSINMGLAFTYGLGEALFFPAEVFRLASTIAVGRELRFEYDENGRIKKVLLDGDDTVDLPRRRLESEQSVATEAEPVASVQQDIAKVAAG